LPFQHTFSIYPFLPSFSCLLFLTYMFAATCWL
jgi:hypothetical protein